MGELNQSIRGSIILLKDLFENRAWLPGHGFFLWASNLWLLNLTYLYVLDRKVRGISLRRYLPLPPIEVPNLLYAVGQFGEIDLGQFQSRLPWS